MIALKFICNLLHSNKSSCEQHHWNLLKYYRTDIYRYIKLAYLWCNQVLSYTKINKQPNSRKLPLDLWEEFGPSLSSFYVINWELLSASLLGNDIYEIVFLYKSSFYHLAELEEASHKNGSDHQTNITCTLLSLHIR